MVSDPLVDKAGVAVAGPGLMCGRGSPGQWVHRMIARLTVLIETRAHPLGLFRARLGTTASPRGKLSLGGGGLARRFRTLYRRFRLFGGRFGAPIEDSDDSGAASSNDADR